MSEVTGYQALGFNTNPFNSNTAEREPEIAEYAVYPPYLDRVAEASTSPGVFFLEGARGSGKSATRLTVAKKLFGGAGGPLIIPVTNFNVFKPYIKGGISLDLYAAQIAFLAIETILSWLSSIDEDTQNKVVAQAKTHERLIGSFVSNFYLNRSDYSRSATAQETYDLLAMSAGVRTQLWMEKRWDKVTGVVAQLANTFAKKHADFDIGDPSSFQKLLERQQGDGFTDPTYIFNRTVEFARAFGFSGIVIQIDKVDETDWTGSDLKAASNLIRPLLSNIAIQEIGDLTWTFFVWDQVSRWMRREYRDEIRFDKIPNGEIEWRVEYLIDLTNERLKHFSSGRIVSLSDISEDAVDANSVLNELIGLTAKSPRNLVSALDHILSTHVQRHPNNTQKMNQNSYEEGMDSYAVKSLNTQGLIEDVRMIAKLNRVQFVTKDVQDLIRQSAQTARGRIEKWIGEGLVRSDGVRPAGAGRPVDQFRLIDARALRVLHRSL